LSLGEWDVPGLLRRIPGSLLLAWAAYDAIEPIGGRRGDWHTAALIATQANCHRNTKLFPRPFHARDFLMNFEAEVMVPPVARPEQKKAKSPQELLALAQRTALLYNRDNQARQKREQDRIERRKNARPLRRTHHGR
jgi:hypothetical protein